MVAEIEDNQPGAGNGAPPGEPPAVDPAPLLGQQLATPAQSPVDPAESVPPPSVPQAQPVAQPAAPAATPQPVAPPAAQPAAPQPAPEPAVEPAAATPAPEPVVQPAPTAAPAALPTATAQPPAVSQAPPITPMPPPPGWYGDIFGNPPRWWDGTAWTEHVLVPLPVAEPVEDGPELNFFDNALISFSLAPDWAKFIAAAVVTAVLALIGLGLISDGSSSDDVPDGFVPQTPELEDQAIPGAPETPVPESPDGAIQR